MRTLWLLLPVLCGAALCVMMVARDSDAQQCGQACLVQDIKLGSGKCKLGEPVKVSFSISNKCSGPIAFDFSSSKLFDIWIQRGELEHYRFSKGRSYLQVLTSLTLQPGETRAFDATWDQKDKAGKQVGPGLYSVYAQLTTSGDRPPRASAKCLLGTVAAAVAPTTIGEAIASVDVLLNRVVEISATYRGWQPNAADPNVKNGPPVSRSDWAICDGTGCMYVSGKIGLHPERDVGKKVVVTGTLKKTPRGQLYLVLQRAKIVKK